ncbi:MAG: fibrobacter succinogenes major paralogous domain-containing protein [Dysgonamonadaceae bacterium]|jgi:uncharacterized protein (TIGR02145 family)|nr:fibrobacter succinogenes major paralogous domain-containing protein [Dysgonamonadaceae bacterium]
MKRKILVLLSFALVLSANLRAQVTIGALTAPASGALVDLNSGVTGGLVLSNVTLVNLKTIPYTSDWFPGINGSNNDTNVDFTGAIVYHTGGNNIPAGIYVWNGKNWTPVGENCLSAEDLTLTLTGTPFAKVSDDVTFSVSSNASAFCSDCERYEWYRNSGGSSPYETSPFASGAIASLSFSPAGTYNVKVVATNDYSDLPVEEEATIYVTESDPPAVLIDGQYNITGDFCYDVKGPKPAGQSQSVYDSRTDAFDGGAFTKTYTFTYANDYSELTVLNSGGIIESVSQPAKTSGTGSGSVTFTITFVSDVKDRVIAAAAPVPVQLLVGFKNNNNIIKVAYKNIILMDGLCGCPAQVPANIRSSGWITFQCHNLGAIHDITSDADLAGIDITNFRGYHGDWYRFGAKNVSLVNDGTYEGNSTVPDWTVNSHPDYPFQNDSQDWIAANNPCPAGWQLPTNDEWSAVAGSNTLKWYIGNVGSDTANPSGWGEDNNNPPACCYNHTVKLGDYLYLPAAGVRNNAAGTLFQRGDYGSFWGSTANGNFGRAINFRGHGHEYSPTTHRSHGASVRCVSAE